jgi:hypothetical protein
LSQKKRQKRVEGRTKESKNRLEGENARERMQEKEECEENRQQKLKIEKEYLQAEAKLAEEKRKAADKQKAEEDRALREKQQTKDGGLEKTRQDEENKNAQEKDSVRIKRDVNIVTDEKRLYQHEEVRIVSAKDEYLKENVRDREDEESQPLQESRRGSLRPQAPRGRSRVSHQGPKDHRDNVADNEGLWYHGTGDRYRNPLRGRNSSSERGLNMSSTENRERDVPDDRRDAGYLPSARLNRPVGPAGNQPENLAGVNGDEQYLKEEEEEVLDQAILMAKREISTKNKRRYLKKKLGELAASDSESSRFSDGEHPRVFKPKYGLTRLNSQEIKKEHELSEGPIPHYVSTERLNKQEKRHHTRHRHHHLFDIFHAPAKGRDAIRAQSNPPYARAEAVRESNPSRAVHHHHEGWQNHGRSLELVRRRARSHSPLYASHTRYR